MNWKTSVLKPYFLIYFFLLIFLGKNNRKGGAFQREEHLWFQAVMLDLGFNPNKLLEDANNARFYFIDLPYLIAIYFF